MQRRRHRYGEGGQTVPFRMCRRWGYDASVLHDATLPTRHNAPMIRSRTRLSQSAREEIAAYLFLSPWLIGFAIFTLGAMAFSLGLSFTKTDLLTSIRFRRTGQLPRTVG